MNALLAAFFVEVGLVTYRSVTGGGTKTPAAAPIPAPLPSLYTSAIVLYGALALIPSSLAPLPALVGWGVVVATWLNLYNPGGANAAAAGNAALGGALGTSPTGVKPITNVAIPARPAGPAAPISK